MYSISFPRQISEISPSFGSPMVIRSESKRILRRDNVGKRAAADGFNLVIDGNSLVAANKNIFSGFKQWSRLRGGRRAKMSSNCAIARVFSVPVEITDASLDFDAGKTVGGVWEVVKLPNSLVV